MAGPGRAGGDDGAATPAGDGTRIGPASEPFPGEPPAEPGEVEPEAAPLISVGPATGSALPHWTEPGTGALPAGEPVPAGEHAAEPAPGADGSDIAPVPTPAPVRPIPANGHRPVASAPGAAPVGADAAGSTPSATAASAPATAPATVTPTDPDGAPGAAGADAAAPADEPAPATARWRSSDGDWKDGDETFFDLAPDNRIPLGALDERDRLRDEQYLTFEDLDVPQADLPTVPPRGSAEDPILIQRTGGAPALPDGSSAPADPAAGPAPGASTEPPDGPWGAGGELAGPVRGEGTDGEPAPDAPGAERSRPPGTPPGPPGRDRGQAIKVGLGIAVATLAIFLIGAFTPLRWVPLILVMAAIVGAMIELFNAALGAGYRPVNLVGVAAGAALPVTAYFAGSPTIPNGESGIVLVLFLSLVACMAWYLFGAGRGRPVPNIAVTLLGIVYVGVLGSFGALILRAGPWPGSATTVEQGIPLIILVVIGTELYDAGGYLLGSRLGRTPLSAASPSKTREGLVLGMVCAVASVVVLGGVLGVGVRSMGEAVILAVVIAAVAPIGDLFESMLKRDLGVKDMSTLIPSHGGLLDRVDALLFTLPACYYTLRILGVL